jgi:hypothetical protein
MHPSGQCEVHLWQAFKSHFSPAYVLLLVAGIAETTRGAMAEKMVRKYVMRIFRVGVCNRWVRSLTL